MRWILFLVVIGTLLSCQKELAPGEKAVVKEEFRKFVIKAGQQSSVPINTYEPVKLTEMRFRVRFDSSAIYQTVLPGNQPDINKLYGFADNNEHHHAYSARFGWRYYNGNLSLHGYVYNDSVRYTQQLAVVEIGREYSCSIKVTGSEYIFSLNGVKTIMSRRAKTVVAEGYRLFPYFGGDEMAPHDITIFIKELK